MVRLGILIVFFALAGFTYTVHSNLKAENEQLRSALENQKMVAATYDELRRLIDSIEIDQSELSDHLDKGKSPQIYIARLKKVNEHIQETHLKIETLEDALKNMDNSQGYLNLIDALRDEVLIKTEKINALESRLSEYQKKGNDLAGVSRN